MPHLVVKLLAGRSELQKQKLADALTRSVAETLNLGDEAVSVSLEEIAPGDWKRKVYEPDIMHGPGKLYKRPGYTPT